MKKALRRSLSLLLAITLVFSSAYVGLSEVDFSSLFAVRAKAATSGTTGDCTWTLDGTVLTISGNGAMGDYLYIEQAPWGNVVTEVVIESGVTNIGKYAFYCCTNLMSVTIPDSVTSIGEYAFHNCDSILSIIIPAGVTSISDDSFSGCDSLKSINISDGVKSIGSFAFGNCNSLASIKIPDSVTSIGEYAFWECDNLKTIEFGKGLKLVGLDAFASDELWNIQEVHIKDIAAWCNIDFKGGRSNPFYITRSVYANGELLADLVIPDEVTSVSDYAFYGYNSLTSVTIHDKVSNIGANSFYGCASLSEFIVDENNAVYSSLEGVLFDESQTKLIKYPSGNEREVYKIPDTVAFWDNAFESCPNLKTIVLNSTMNNIYNGSFGLCKLDSVVIPVNVASIGAGAFGSYSYSKKISDVYYEGTEEQWEDILIAANNDKLTDGRLHYRVDIFDWENHYGAPVTTQPTCTQNGNNKYTCPCGYEKTEVIPYTGHNYSAEWTIDVAPTCTTSGSKSQHCTKCTAKRNVTYISSTGHTSSDWIIDNDNMLKYKECTVCKTVLASESIYAIPATPKVTTSNEIGGVKVNWNAVEGAVKYNVYRRQGGSSAWVYAGTTTGTTLLDTSVNSGVYYIYSVRAYNYVGQYSAFVSANTSTRKYMAVPKLVSISNAINGLHIKWDAVDGVTNGYRVYRRGAGSSYWTYLGTVKTTSYTDTAVKDNGGEYFRYTVIADGGYHSKFDITGLYLRRIGTPVLKSATSIAVGNIVRWGTVKGCNEYYVYRKTSNSNWVRIGAIDGANSSAFVDTTAKKGTTYTYTVKAVYGKTMSAYNSGVNCYTKY